MRTEISKTFERGFLLSEQELRRIHDTVVQHVARRLQPDEMSRMYEIKYANGGISHPSSIDEVLREENIGSKSIVRFGFVVSGKTPEHNIYIRINFCNAERDSGSWSIKYDVVGGERDWVFVATSDLNERLNRILTLGSSEGWRKGLTSLMGISMAAALLYLVFGLRQNAATQSDALERIQQAWQKGELKDPVDAMLQLERARQLSTKNDYTGSFPAMIAIPIILVAIQITSSPIGKIYAFLFPQYTFYWGEAVAEYDRRQRMTRLLLGTILGGTVLSILANLLTDVFFNKGK